jgi:hypothetical protein
MMKVKIALFPLLLSYVFCLAQTKPKRFLYSLYDNFPIDSSVKCVANYYKSKNCTPIAEIYDTGRIDYSCELHNWSVFDYKPTSIDISFFNCSKDPLGDTTPKITLVVALNVHYQDTASKNAIKQYEILLEKFGKIYKHHKKLFIVTSHGKEGEEVMFYIHRLSKLPVLTIELVYEHESFLLGTVVSSLDITYNRSHSFSKDK